ncbi:hypothetical protein DXG01_004913 [Tephrocybe rancida]|nr:hypothetical protein DXG01_004913 [Tephrocybe rancida]
MTDTRVPPQDPAPPAADASTAITTPPAVTTPPATTTTTSPPPAVTPPATTTTDTAPTTTTTTTTLPPPATETETETRPKDPRIASLHAMFPDYDELILYSVLDSVGGDEALAVDALLAMSDPDYIAPPTADVNPAPTDLDEQLARRLMLEEQAEHQAAWQAQQDARRPRLSQQHHGQLQAPQGQGQQQGQQGQQGQGDTMAEIQQQLGKFAERALMGEKAGKKTFGTLFNKVKAKIAEMDQPRTGQPSNQTWDPAMYEQSTYQTSAQANVPYATRPSAHSTPGHAQQPAYYDPNAGGASPEITLGGYDAEPVAAPVVAPRTTTPPPAAPSAADTPRAGLTSPPIDGGKLGLLPKRPVALLRPGDQTQLQRTQSQESDDGLEYAESPFEETPRK